MYFSMYKCTHCQVKKKLYNQCFKFTSTSSNCQYMLKKSIIMLAKKLPTLILYGTQILYLNPKIFQKISLSCWKCWIIIFIITLFYFGEIIQNQNIKIRPATKSWPTTPNITKNDKTKVYIIKTIIHIYIILHIFNITKFKNSY